MASDPSLRGTRRAVRIGKYEVVAHIATGGMGAVYRALDTEQNREVALKVLSPENAANPATLERFRREARHAAKLRHDNIVTLYECGEANGTHYLAMEFIDGIDLHDYINRKGQLEPEEARLITIQAAQALDHANGQGIVHRDIKPSNFLLTQKDGRLVVKLTDMGLAREAREDEFRVTRDGSTVGTVDYLSPEQARDSRAADVRSDIYSLGCTLYHMLAGRPPFPSGNLAERIYKHIQVEPPDVRQFNLQVSEPFWDVLRRMLAKDPARRYQSPAELLHDLNLLATLEGPLRELDEDAELVEIEEEKPATAEPSAAPKPARRKRRAVRDAGSDPDRKRVATVPRHAVPKAPSSSPRLPRRGTERPDTAEPPAARTRPIITRPSPWPRVAAGAAVLLTLATLVAVAALVWPRRPPSPPPDDSGNVVQPSPGAQEPELLERPPRLVGEVKPLGPRSRWPALYRPAVAVDANRLRQELEKPWAAPAPVPDTVYRVSRSPRGSGQFESLAAAVAAAPPVRGAVIEICDNGPLFETPIQASERNLVIRAGKGFRPLLVWDWERGRAGGASESALFSVSRGNLTLEGLDVAVRWGEPAGADRPALAQVSDGDFLARDCTFSVAGRIPGGAALVRFDGGTAGKRCRLSRCFARGQSLVALDLTATGAEVLIDGCLLVGGEQPLLRVAAANEDSQVLNERRFQPPHLRVVRSTLVAGQTLLQVRPRTADDTRPALTWQGWDALLARPGPQTGGELLAVAGGAGADGIRWRAVNCLYVGWRTLLAGREPITADEHVLWLRRWQMSEGDAAVHQRWPAVLPPEPAEAPPDLYRTDDTPAAFAATAADGPLGCDLAALPPVRDGWLALAFRRFPPPTVDLLTDALPPAIPAPGDELYHGGRLDLNTTDLGAHLQKLIASGKKLGPRVVLHLAGSGERPTTPIRVRGSSLVLYFEPPERKPTAPAPAPLVLVPPAAGTPTQEALIEVEDGDLEIIRGDIRFPDSNLALVPRYLLAVRGGSLLLYGTRLQGPLAQPPAAFQGLIRLEGKKSAKPDGGNGCGLNRSILLSGKNAIDALGGDLNIRLQHCLIAARQDGLHLDPGRSPARLAGNYLLENCTVAAQRAALFLGDVPWLNRPPAEPILFQAKACAFLNPFTAPPASALLLFEGDALARGLLVWYGEGNVYDSRLPTFAAPAGAAPTQTYSLWQRLWGSPGDRQALLDVPLKGRLDAKLAPLENLALTGLPRTDHPPGANLVQLGVVRPPKP